MRRQLSRLGRLVHVAAGVVIASEIGSAQCLEWQPGFGAPGINGEVYALEFLDDGSGGGPTLVAGGYFTLAGNTAARCVARWSPADWFGFASGAQFDVVLDVVSFDDGTGPSLYVGGVLSPPEGAGGAYGIARWDGAAWRNVGLATPAIPQTSDVKRDLIVFDDGSGPALFACGDKGVARWDGASWSDAGQTTNGFAMSLCVHDDGGGSALFCGGSFAQLGGVAVSRIAKRSGSTWAPLGVGVSGGFVGALQSYDDGAGPALYAGGQFTSAGGAAANRIARWKGGTWSPLGSGIQSFTSLLYVQALTVYGGALYAGGAFDTAGGLPAQNVARWDGSSWSAVGGGITLGVNIDVPVNALAVADVGSGPALIAGGAFVDASGVAVSNLAQWTAADGWKRVTEGAGVVPDTDVSSRDAVLSAKDPASGAPRVYVGGRNLRVGDLPMSSLVAWNGSEWSIPGSGVNGTVLRLHTLASSGACPEVIAAGKFTSAGGSSANNIAAWNGASWSSLGGGVTGAVFGVGPIVRALATYTSGDETWLYVGGSFTTAAGAPAASIARWNGSSWQNAGSIGAAVTPDSGVNAMVVHDDGSGSKLYVGGYFNSVGDALNGPQPADNIARWNGTSYELVGAGLPNGVTALGTADDGLGGGIALYAGVNVGSSCRIHRWDGAAWTTYSELGFGSVTTLMQFDDGTGPSLYAAVARAPSGFGPTLPGLVRRTATGWDPVGGGLVQVDIQSGAPQSGRVDALAVHAGPSGDPTDLLAVGDFAVGGAQGTYNIGVYRGCSSPPGTPFCFGDGSLAVSCPCTSPDFVPNPPAAIGHGCANSFHLDGAQLFASGSTANDDVVLASRAQTPSGFSFFIVGTADIVAGFATADGVRCAGGAITRFGSQFAVCGSVRYPNPAAGWTLPLSTVSGTTPGSGLTKYYQVFYRNAAAGFCSAGTANFTSGYRVTW